MNKKKRANKKELDYLAKFTDERLSSRGIRKSVDESIIETIKADPSSPPLPGLKDYLPQPLMINLGRRAMRDLAREWQLETKKDIVTQNKFDEFYKFVVKRLNTENFAMQKYLNEQAVELNGAISRGEDTSHKTVAQWLRPHDMKELMQVLSIFIIDSFVVALWKKTASDTPEFVEWFFRWTEQLLGFFPANLKDTGKISVEVQVPNHKKE